MPHWQLGHASTHFQEERGEGAAVEEVGEEGGGVPVAQIKAGRAAH